MTSIYQSIYHNKRDGRCEATVVTVNGFQRQPITPAQFQAIALRLARFIVSSGPTCVHFNAIAQKEATPAAPAITEINTALLDDPDYADYLAQSATNISMF